MQKILNLIKNEPAAILAMIQAIIALLIAFGMDVSQAQIAAILGVFTALQLVVRSLVTPNNKLPPAPPEG